MPAQSQDAPTSSMQDNNDDVVPEPLQLGDLVLDRYRVDERIALGGHSVVYRGTDERLSRPVCIKTFYKISEDAGVWATIYEHFVQEAFALSKLNHPNTLRIYDFGYLGESGPVQVSEYMAGGTLAGLIRQTRRLPPKDALTLICKLADALAEAHSLGIVHRDIKPQNILFTAEGSTREPKLADFGIAKSVTQDNVMNQAGDTRIVAGFPLAMYSPSWASPEQLCGASVTPAADVYSLGLITVFALTGKVICAAKSTQEGYEVRGRAEELVRTALEDVGVEADVTNLLISACAFRKQDRPANAAKFVTELRAAHDAPLPVTSPLLMPSLNEAPLPLPPPPQNHPKVAEGTEVKRRRMAQAGEPTAATMNSFRAPLVTPQGTLQRGEDVQRALPHRQCQFLECGLEAVTLNVCGKRIQLSGTPMPSSPSGCSLIVKGLSTFVAQVGGRPTSAVHVTQDGVIHLVDPRQQAQGSLRISFGRREGDAQIFEIGGSQVALGRREFPNVVLVDNPNQQHSHFLYGLVGASSTNRPKE